MLKLSRYRNPNTQLIKRNQKWNFDMQEFFHLPTRPRNCHLVTSIIERKWTLDLAYFPILHDFPNINEDFLQGKTREIARQLEETVLRNVNNVHH